METSTPLEVTATPVPTRGLIVELPDERCITIQYVDIETNVVMDVLVLRTTLSERNAERVINFYGQMLLSQTHRPVFVLSELADGSHLLHADQPSLWEGMFDDC